MFGYRHRPRLVHFQQTPGTVIAHTSHDDADGVPPKQAVKFVRNGLRTDLKPKSCLLIFILVAWGREGRAAATGEAHRLLWRATSARSKASQRAGQDAAARG
jgi:hypothetical protein